MFTLRAGSVAFRRCGGREFQRPYGVGAAALLGIAILSTVGRTADDVSFSRDIRPILAEHCFQCHGPDSEKRAAELRLDTRTGALAAAESGERAVVPEHPEQSELVRRITASDEGERMPPASTKKTLKPEQIALLQRWIAAGASYQEHWAFSAPKRPALPAAQPENWIRNPLDRFILARLNQEGLAPSPEADRITLLRRVYLDLLGLPPTIEQVDAFLADDRPGAWERVVEELLRSPHYGERWARHWLDAARYADSDGFEKDKSRQVSFYRDYVIGAFQRDLPFHQFLVEQLAGDLLPQATQDQIVATGFLRNSMINEEGGIDPEQFRMDAMFDRMDVLGKSILGLTISCGQCHSHKYDPFSQEEYYRLFAFLNNDHESQRVVYSPEEQQQVAELMRRIQESELRLQQQTPDWPARLAAWEATVAGGQPAWTILPIENAGDNAQRYLPQGDGSVLAQGYAPTKFTAQFRASVEMGPITAFRLELLNDPNLPCQGPGRSFQGTCALSEFSVEAAPAANPNQKVKVKIVEATSDFVQPERELEANFYDKTQDRRVTGPVALAIDGDGKTAWGIDAGPGRRNQPRKAVFRLEAPLNIAGPVVLTFSLQQNHGGWNSDDHMNNNLGRFRLSATTASGTVAADPLPAAVREAVSIPADRRTPEQRGAVFSYWRTTVPEWREANEQIEGLWKQWPVGSTALTLSARTAPRDTRLLQRGDWLKPTRPVVAGTPAVLNPLPADAPPTRLTLARWLTDRQAPTTARVFVNRVWQAYFGVGLVSTPEDFGVKGEPPSHPELLDWLAVEFMENGWSVKHLHRLITGSATYRQSSRATPELLQRDPQNRLLARAPRLRVEGEIVRDVALSVSGLLNPQVGGRSVMSPAPEFLFQPPASYAPFPWVNATGPDKYRRGIYTFRRRSTPYPMLQAFDVPNGDAACVRRLRSNSPLQALVSLNEPIFVECAQSLARIALARGGTTDDSRLTYAFRRAVARPPAPEELAALRTLLEKQQRRLADGWLDPRQIASTNGQLPAELPGGATPTQLAAYTLVARVLLNLDETISKE
ncbi:MAG: PSD1 and planctomycete cytochrome C domain-containing protein [Pirellulales bacterium]